MAGVFQHSKITYLRIMLYEELIKQRYQLKNLSLTITHSVGPHWLMWINYNWNCMSTKPKQWTKAGETKETTGALQLKTVCSDENRQVKYKLKKVSLKQTDW